VLRLKSDIGNKVHLTDAATLPEPRDNVDVPVSTVSPNSMVTIHRLGSTSCDPPDDSTAYCFHDGCYVILSLKLGHSPEFTTELYKLAQTLTDQVAPWDNKDSYRKSRYNLRLLSHPPNRIKTEEGIFNSLSKLPPELKVRILDQLSPGIAYTAFMLVSNETLRLVSSLSSKQDYNLDIPLGSFLSFEMISVFGIEYIQSIATIQAPREQVREGLQVTHDVKRLKVVVSGTGVCAIQLLGDEDEIGWIGKLPAESSKWYGAAPPESRLHFNVSQSMHAM
jgi:hypothetical protein